MLNQKVYLIFTDEGLTGSFKDMAKDIKDLEKSVIQNEAQIDILNKQKTDLQTKLSNSEEVLNVSNEILELDSIYTSIQREVELKDKFLVSKEQVALLQKMLDKLSYNEEDVTNLDRLFNDYTALNSKVTNYKNTSNDIGDLNKRLDKYKDMDDKPIDDLYNDYIKTESLVDRYYKISMEVDTIGAKINTMITNIEIEEKKLSEFKVCPLCGGDLKC